jgi:hypothetical protein
MELIKNSNRINNEIDSLYNHNVRFGGLICWDKLSQNPSIFTYDYDYLKFKMDIIREELYEVFLHLCTFKTRSFKCVKDILSIYVLY